MRQLVTKVAVQPYSRLKKFTCGHCGKTFHTKADLRRHIKSHTGEKSFSCDICSYRWSTSYGIKIHKKTHTKIVKADEKPTKNQNYEDVYQCPFCFEKFNDISALNSHKKLCHKTEYVALNSLKHIKITEELKGSDGNIDHKLLSVPAVILRKMRD